MIDGQVRRRRGGLVVHVRELRSGGDRLARARGHEAGGGGVHDGQVGDGGRDVAEIDGEEAIGGQTSRHTLARRRARSRAAGVVEPGRRRRREPRRGRVHDVLGQVADDVDDAVYSRRAVDADASVDDRNDRQVGGVAADGVVGVRRRPIAVGAGLAVLGGEVAADGGVGRGEVDDDGAGRGRHVDLDGDPPAGLRAAVRAAQLDRLAGCVDGVDAVQRGIPQRDAGVGGAVVQGDGTGLGRCAPELEVRWVADDGRADRRRALAPAVPAVAAPVEPPLLRCLHDPARDVGLHRCGARRGSVDADVAGVSGVGVAVHVDGQAPGMVRQVARRRRRTSTRSGCCRRCSGTSSR